MTSRTKHPGVGLSDTSHRVTRVCQHVSTAKAHAAAATSLRWPAPLIVTGGNRQAKRSATEANDYLCG